jgi:hypothetical protein
MFAKLPSGQPWEQTTSNKLAIGWWTVSPVDLLAQECYPGENWGLGKWVWSWIRWTPGKETLGPCILKTCYYSPSPHILHQLNGNMGFHLLCYEVHCTAIGCWLAVAFRNQVRKLVTVLDKDFSLTPSGWWPTPWVLHLKLGQHSDF